MSNPQVELHVTINVADTATQGVITLELDAVNAPKSTENFLNYVNQGFYNGTIFHRVIKNFMIQGGGFTADMKQKESGTPIENEAKNGLKNDKYTIAMARTSDPHSATAQFFINTVDNAFLNHTAPTGQGWTTRQVRLQAQPRRCLTLGIVCESSGEGSCHASLDRLSRLVSVVHLKP